MTYSPVLNPIFLKPQFGLPSLLQMTQQLIQAKSISSPDASRDMSNRAVIDLLSQWCEDLGMTTHLQEVDTGKWNLFATIEPTFIKKTSAHDTTQGLMLAGHTDTVDFLPSQWESDPFELQLKDQHWVGLGICDMKGFFPIALYAIGAALNSHSHHEITAPISLLATCDEETTMAGARALSKDIKAHNVIIGEPSGNQPIYTHKGILTTKFILTGIRGHASNPGLGANAIEAAHWIISQLLSWRETLTQTTHNAFKIPHPTLSLGCIHGGTNSNVICDECELIVDMRLLPNMSPEAIETELSQRLSGLSDAVPQTQLTMERIEHLSPFTENKQKPFFDFISNAAGQPLGSSDFVTEAPLIQQLGHTPVICGPGTIEWAHKPNECLPIASIEPMLATLLKCLAPLFIPKDRA